MNDRLSWADMFRIFLRIGLMSFGGPAGQIALMHRELVESRGWLTQEEYLNALSFCMLLPGPEAMQLATYAGWRLRGVPGGVLAGLLFVIPGAVVILALAFLYGIYGAVGWAGALFLGVKAAVVVIVIEALLKVSKRALKQRAHWVIAALAFLGIFFLDLPFPLLVAFAAVYGFFAAKPEPAIIDAAQRGASLLGTVRTVLIWLTIWWLPLGILALVKPGSILVALGLFFAKLSVVTFGGAYAVLAYMSQEVVTGRGWMEAGQMIDALGLAETTPGPLILVTEFVGYMAAFGVGGIGLGIMGAMVALWMTFAPCFLWIFAGAPFIDRLTAQPRLRNALAAVTASVVGVILNLTLWFGLHVQFGHVARVEKGPLTLWLPDIASVNWIAVVLTAVAFVLLIRLHWGLGKVLAISALGGLFLSMLG